MSRSGYHDDMDDVLAYGRWRAQVASATRGERGQKFFTELATAMDAMPNKRLIAEALVTQEGECCAMGVVCKARGIEEQAKSVDETDPESVGNLIGIARQLAAEVAYENDECGYSDETPEQRWIRMRAWVQEQIKESA